MYDALVYVFFFLAQEFYHASEPLVNKYTGFLGVGPFRQSDAFEHEFEIGP